MKITLLEPLGVSAETIENYGNALRAAGHTFHWYDTVAGDPDELIKRGGDSDVVMIANHPYPKEAILANPNLKMIAVAFTGIDHVAADVCKDKGILVCNAAGYSNQTVAELAVGMAVSGLRNVRLGDQRVRDGGTSAGIGGREICGRTVGIVGLGRIGFMTAKLFLAFGATVIAYNRSCSEEAGKLGIRYCPINEVLSASDIVSLHLPLNQETRGFMNAERIRMMKPDAVFINCARGPIVDNKALAEALNEDRLGYACVDVFDMEPPLPSDYPLLAAKNTLLTPHQAFISEEAMLRRARIVFGNVEAWLKGEPQNVCRV